jgi:hypothetical protein
MLISIYGNVFQSSRSVITVNSGSTSLMMILCEITSGTNAIIHLAVVVDVVVVVKEKKLKEILPVMISNHTIVLSHY